MSILGPILGLAGLGVAGGLAVWFLGADKVMGAIRQGLGLVMDALAWLAKNPAYALALAAGVFALLQWQDARHWKKQDARDAAGKHELALILGGVKAEVDRGVGRPTRADQAAFYIRRFVDNVVTLKRINEREEAGIRQSAKDAADTRAGAHHDAQPTAVERGRDKLRLKITDPARATGLSADEWNQL
jgi:hypothetical protein